MRLVFCCNKHRLLVVHLSNGGTNDIMPNEEKSTTTMNNNNNSLLISVQTEQPSGQLQRKNN
jgi:hypothetical protein